MPLSQLCYSKDGGEVEKKRQESTNYIFRIFVRVLKDPLRRKDRSPLKTEVEFFIRMVQDGSAKSFLIWSNMEVEYFLHIRF